MDRRQRLARLYRRSLHRQEQVVRLVSAVHQGVWLGLLDREALSLIDEMHYNEVAEPVGGRPAKYTEDDWNLRGLFDWEAELVDTYLDGARRVAVTGAGGGREVVALLERGFDPVGFEPNEQLVEAGSRLLEARGHAGRLRVSQRDGFPAGSEPWDAVLVGWGSYTLIPGRGRRIAFLRDARAVLPDGAPIVLSFFHSGPSRRLPKLSAAIANVLRRLRRAELVEPGDALGYQWSHWFTRDEIQRELAAAGFELIHFAAAPYAHAVGRAQTVSSGS